MFKVTYLYEHTVCMYVYTTKLNLWTQLTVSFFLGRISERTCYTFFNFEVPAASVGSELN